MNELEKALAQKDNEWLDGYLETESTANIRKHIEELILKATTDKTAFEKIQAIEKILNGGYLVTKIVS